jgi:hypothetical protein
MVSMKHGVIGGNFLVHGRTSKKKNKPVRIPPLVHAHTAPPAQVEPTAIDVIELSDTAEESVELVVVPEVVPELTLEQPLEQEPDIQTAELVVYGGPLSAEISIDEPPTPKPEEVPQKPMSKKARKKLKLLKTSDEG